MNLVFSINVVADDLAAKANILIDPAELQAVTMDDLDEDEESAVSMMQVSLILKLSNAPVGLGRHENRGSELGLWLMK